MEFGDYSTNTSLEIQDRSSLDEKFVKTLVKPALLKRAYHIAHIVCSEVFSLSPVTDTIQNLMFPN